MSTPPTIKKGRLPAAPVNGYQAVRLFHSSPALFSGGRFLPVLQFNKDPGISAQLFIFAIDPGFHAVRPLPAEGGFVFNPPFHQNQRLETEMPIPAEIPVQIDLNVDLRVMLYIRDEFTPYSGKNKMALTDPNLQIALVVQEIFVNLLPVVTSGIRQESGILAQHTPVFHPRQVFLGGKIITGLQGQVGDG